MTICFFSAQYLPTVGGVERYTYNLARRVVKAGHKALVVTSALPGLPDHETDAEGIEIIRLPVWPLMNGRFPVPRPGREFKRLAALLWGRRIDFCLINTRFYVSSLYAARQAARRRIPAIVVDHSTGHLLMNSALLNAAGAAYEHFAASVLKHYRMRFFGVSRAVCRWLEHFGIKAEGQLYNAVDPAEVRALAHAPDAIDWRSELGLASDAPLAAFVGRIILEKGVAELIKAFTDAAVPGAALAVAGDGPLLAELKKDCPPNVHLRGRWPTPRRCSCWLRARSTACPPTTPRASPPPFWRRQPAAAPS